MFSKDKAMEQSKVEQSKIRKRGRGRKRELFDRLKKQEQRANCSVWKGSKGVYVFENTGVLEARKPIRKVYLNRAYLTGLFKSKQANEYLGDLRELDNRIYLIFKLVGNEALEIYKK